MIARNARFRSYPNPHNFFKVSIHLPFIFEVLISVSKHLLTTYFELNFMLSHYKSRYNFEL